MNPYGVGFLWFWNMESMPNGGYCADKRTLYDMRYGQ